MESTFIKTFVHIALFLGETYFILSIFLVGYNFSRKDIFAKALILALFSMIFNPFLKSIFQVPLPPTLIKENTFAFPSGHTQLSFVLWASLAYDFGKPWLYALAAFIIASIGFALVYSGFHWPMDIAGAIFFGTLSIIFVNYIQYKFPVFNKKIYYLSFLMALVSVPMFLQIPFKKEYSHAWTGLSALLGFGLGTLIFEKLNRVPNSTKLFATISFVLSIVLIILIEIIFKQFSLGFSLQSFVKYFILAFSLSGVAPVLTKLIYNAVLPDSWKKASY